MANRIDHYNQMARSVLAEMKIEELMMNGVAPTVDELIEKNCAPTKKK